MESRDNLLEKFNTAQSQVASLLEGIMNEKSEIKTQRDKLSLRLKESHITINVLRRQIELYKVSHSKLKSIFLSGLEVFKKVDFGSKASLELNKFSLEILQKHFLELADEVGSISEIPTERQLERYVSKKNTKFVENSNTRRIILSSSDSEDVGPDDTYIEFGTAWNPDKSGGDEELLRDSGLESVKEEIGANENDLSDIQFGEDFFVEFAAGETNIGRSEVVKGSNVTGTENIAVPNTGGSSTANGSLVRVKTEVMILDENEPNPAGNQNPQGRNTPESLHGMNCQRNEPAREINNTKILDETPRQETSVPVVCNHSRELYDSSALEKGLVKSSQYRGGMTRQETFREIRSETRCCKTPVTAPAVDMTSTVVNPRSRSPVFKDCNFRRHCDRCIADFSRNCSTPFRQLNENLGKTLSNPRGYSRTPTKKKLFGRRSTYTKPGQEEDGPSGARRSRLDADRFKGNNQEQGVKSENRENESLEREELSDYSVYDNTTEEDDDDDDIIYGSPGKDNQLYLNSRRQEVRRENAEEPSCRPIPQKSDTPDLDETFISPSAVKKYQMSRAMGPPMRLPPGHHTQEVSPEYDSVPFAYQRGPVRKRAERMKLPGQACAECDKYYNNVYGHASTSDYNQMLNKCSRHRNAGGQDDTPPGYWTPFLTGNEEA